MFSWIAAALAWLYALTHNYGISIMLLTLGIMVVLTPLTLKGTRSMIALQRLQPEMKKLQNRYKDDRQKLNEEMMAFYKENNISPVGGCLPLVVQMPVFFVLYRVLYGLTQPAPYAQDMGRQFAFAQHNTAAQLPNFGAFRPQHLSHTTEMYKALSTSHQMMSFGIDLAVSATHAIRTSLVTALPYLVLILLIGVTAWYQQRQIMGRTPNMASQSQQQQMMMKIMPYFLPLISFALPADITLYFLVSNGYRILQQAFITRTMYVDEHGNPIVTTATDTSSEEDAAPQGFFAQFKSQINDSQTRIADSKQASQASKNGAKGQGRANLAKGAKGGAQAKGGQSKGSNQAKGGQIRPGQSKSNGGKPPAKDGTAKPVTRNAGSTRPAPKSGSGNGAAKKQSNGSNAPQPTDKSDAVEPIKNDAPADSKPEGPINRPSRSAPAPNPDRKRRG